MWPSTRTAKVSFTSKVKRWVAVVGEPLFQLPPGYRPARESILAVTAICDTCNPEAQPLAIAGSDVLTYQDGQINLVLNSGANVSFDWDHLPRGILNACQLSPQCASPCLAIADKVYARLEQNNQKDGEMRRLRPKLTYANVVSTLCLLLCSEAQAPMRRRQLGKNSVGPKQLKKNAVTTAKIKKEAITAAKVKKGALTGAQINASTLGTVPSAQNSETAAAQTASTIAAPEAWHEVGAPGEPPLEAGWQNPGENSNAPTLAFFKDHEGIVYLRGVAYNNSGYGPIFTLPPGFRPDAQRFDVVVGCGPCGEQKVGRVSIVGGGAIIGAGDEVVLNGISFRAESYTPPSPCIFQPNAPFVLPD